MQQIRNGTTVAVVFMFAKQCSEETCCQQGGAKCHDFDFVVCGVAGGEGGNPQLRREAEAHSRLRREMESTTFDH